MKSYKSLSRNVANMVAFERLELNVFDIATKKIIFTGTAREIAKHVGSNEGAVRSAKRFKTVLMKKYAIRIKSTKS